MISKGYKRIFCNMYMSYTHGKIYQLVHRTVGIVYVGSTRISLQRRFQLHRAASKKQQWPIYMFVQKCGGWDDIYIDLLEKYPCFTRYELECRERYWIEKLRPPGNKNMPASTRRQSSRKTFEDV